MNRPTMLLRRILYNYSIMTRTTIERDVRVIERRFKDEGMSFLTITLPTLDDALLRGLTEGRITPLMFNGFKPFKRGGKLPAFLSGFFMRIFEADGLLKTDPCIDSIEAIRQVTRLYKKVELPCSTARYNQAFERYKSNEQELFSNRYGSSPDRDYFPVVSSYLWSDLEFRASDLYCSSGIFGSGATAERYRFYERHTVREWPTRGESYFPASYHTSHREDDRESFNSLRFLRGKEERPIRVVTVPKTLKTPRIIGVEPSYMMLRQQSIWLWLHQYLEGISFPFESIRFSSQEENRELARTGSIDGGLATIDLSDASDRVSNRLVATTFKSAPSFLRMIFAARTRSAVLPGGELLNLRKFASMGSALCFPIESMVFFTIVLTSMVKQSGKRPSRGLLRRLSKDIAVYGDDIIVPAQMVPGVMEDLEAYGLKVNHDKSFSNGHFRESCGGDYYRGELNSPIYVRRLEDPSRKRLASQDVAAYISLSNQFYMKGLWHVSQYIRDYLSRRGINPGRSTEEIGGLTYSSRVFTDAIGICKKTHKYLVRSYQARVKRQRDPVTSTRAAMLYSFGGIHNEYRSHPIYDLTRVLEHSNGGSTMGGELDLLSRHGTLFSPGDLREGGNSPCRPSDDSGLPRRSGANRGFDPWRAVRQYEATARVPYDGTSVRPYTLGLKCRKTPTFVGLVW